MRSAAQKRVELAGPVERDQIVASPDMHLANKYLRDGPTPSRLCFHFSPRIAVHKNIDLVEHCPLFLQQ
jgi:hypothetical protein